MQCQAKRKSQIPCTKPNEEDSRFCLQHAGNRVAREKVRTLAKQNKIATTKRYIDQKGGFQAFVSLVESVTMQRYCIQEKWNAIETKEDLLRQVEPISKMVARSAFTVQKLVKISNLLNQNLFTKDSIDAYNEVISEIIFAYIAPEYHEEVAQLMEDASPLLTPNQPQLETI